MWQTFAIGLDNKNILLEPINVMWPIKHLRLVRYFHKYLQKKADPCKKTLAWFFPLNGYVYTKHLPYIYKHKSDTNQIKKLHYKT